MKSIFALLAIFGSLLVGCKAPWISPAAISNEQNDTWKASEINALMEEYRDSLNSPGIMIGILENGNRHFYGFGEKKLGSNEAPDKDTYFEIGSVTKTFTAAGTFMLLNHNQLSPEISVNHFLEKREIHLEKDGKEPTIRQVLTHTSGLAYMPGNFGLILNLAKSDRKWAAYDESKLYSDLTKNKLKNMPGEKQVYSNLGFGMLGQILENESEKDYKDWLKDEVLTPLGMNKTSADFTETNPSNWATGYLKGEEMPYWKSLNAMNGAGVIKSTANDMLTYAAAQMNPPAGSLGNAIKRTQEVQSQVPAIELGNRRARFCQNWIKFEDTTDSSLQWYYHDGGTAGFNTHFAFDPNKQKAIILWFNQTGDVQGRDSFLQKLLELLGE